MSAVKCHRGDCNGPVVIGTDGQGRALATCLHCERRRKGVCLDCPARAVRKSRCDPCRKRRERARSRRRRGTKPRHARNEQGLCLECPSTLASPNAERCPPCAKRRATKLHTACSVRRYRTDAAYRTRTLDHLRERYATDPELRARTKAKNARQVPPARDELQRKVERARRAKWLAKPGVRDQLNRKRRRRHQWRMKHEPGYAQQRRDKKAKRVRSLPRESIAA